MISDTATDLRALAQTDRPLAAEELQKIDAYWRAANYLSVGQIYLYDNPLLKEPLKLEHVKPRLLGHWGTTPGLNLIYAHLNRVIQKRDLNVMFVTGPGHGATLKASSACSPNSRFPAVFRATAPRRLRAPSTKVANWDTRCCTPMVPPSTIRT
jgi:phosphoketolase